MIVIDEAGVKTEVKTDVKYLLKILALAKLSLWTVPLDTKGAVTKYLVRVHKWSGRTNYVEHKWSPRTINVVISGPVKT